MGFKKAFVTGGAGFIGTALVEKLVEMNMEVVVYDNLLRGNKLDKSTMEKITFIKGDVRDRDKVILSSSGCDVIFHLAAVLGVDIVADNPVETMEVETMGMHNVAEACLVNGIKKVLYASTSGIYGHNAIEQAVTEDIVVDPRTSYAMAKRYNEIYLGALHEEKGLDTIALRFFNVYGPKQDNRMVIPRFIEQAKAGDPITVFGSGKQTRDFTWIDDTVQACVSLMEKVSGYHIVNIANEDEGCIEDLAFTIKKVTESNSEIKYLDAPKKRYDYEVERRVGSSLKLEKLTGFKPSTNLEDGLMRILNQTKS